MRGEILQWKIKRKYYSISLKRGSAIKFNGEVGFVKDKCSNTDMLYVAYVPYSKTVTDWITMDVVDIEETITMNRWETLFHEELKGCKDISLFEKLEAMQQQINEVSFKLDEVYHHYSSSIPCSYQYPLDTPGFSFQGSIWESDAVICMMCQVECRTYKLITLEINLGDSGNRWDSKTFEPDEGTEPGSYSFTQAVDFLLEDGWKYIGQFENLFIRQK